MSEKINSRNNSTYTTYLCNYTSEKLNTNEKENISAVCLWQTDAHSNKLREQKSMEWKRGFGPAQRWNVKCLGQFSYICFHIYHLTIIMIEDLVGYLITERVVVITSNFCAINEEISFRLKRLGEVQMGARPLDLLWHLLFSQSNCAISEHPTELLLCSFDRITSLWTILLLIMYLAS